MKTLLIISENKVFCAAFVFFETGKFVENFGEKSPEVDQA